MVKGINMTELHEVSQAIGRLEANGENQAKLVSKLFDKLDAVHECVRRGQTNHHDRISVLETCKNSMDTDVKPQLKAISAEMHKIKEGIFKSKIKALILLLGISGSGGTAGAFIAKWWG